MKDPNQPESASPSPNPTIRLNLPDGEKPGERIGRYKLLQIIGEGGMGSVWMAEQEEPVRRRVALKVIKLGMDTKQVIGRFEAERQALALMDHPNIAKVLDAGATENGRPFFAMELVKGIPITKYCDDHKLNTEERLRLFTDVCHAIQHAHQKGIIHRDIKPSNILVTLNDGVPMPKVIDFGIAKATTGQALTDKTVFTALEQFIGTPAYMSPEQAEMNSLDIDTRSDIYALGVLLYELLTGKTPFDAKDLLAKGLDEIRRIIREEEPPRPSTRLRTLDATEQTILANQRHSEPPKLLGIIRGDLDWIVMKTLEKDRTRRYDTANGLAMDVQRYLHNEPIVARPPSATYKFQKLVRRNKLAFASAGAVLAVIVVGLSASAWMFRSQRNALQRALHAEKVRSQMEHDLNLRQLRAASLDRFVGKANNLLVSAEKEVATSLESLRKEGRTQTDEGFHLLSDLADLVRAQGRLAEAELLQRQAVEAGKKTRGASDAQVLNSFLRWGVLLRSQGRLWEAEAVFREQLQAARATMNTTNIGIALASLTLTLLYDRKFTEAEPTARELLAVNEKDYPGLWFLFNARSMLGEALLGQKKYGEAEPLLLTGYDGMKQREKSISTVFRYLRLKEAIERIVNLYEQTGRPTEAGDWRDRAEEWSRANTKGSH